jgi:uncharacterized membrane protein YphA (DoxX/SURF4 family)
MLASIFVVQGLETFRHPERFTELAEPVVRPVAAQVPPVPDDTEQAVRLNGAIQVAAGTTLGLGVLPRISALVLAGTLVPTTLAGHRYWTIPDPEERERQRVHFLKNLTMMGGLLIAAADTGGSPSLSWRRKKAARSASHHLADVQQSLAESGRTASDQLAVATSATAASARAAGDQISHLTEVISEVARTAGGYLAELSQTVAESARKAGDQLPDAAQEAGALARAAADQVTDAAQATIEAGRRAAHQLTS